MNIVNENGAVILEYKGFKVKQRLNGSRGRYYVWLPKRSGLREFLGKKNSWMLRSHFVYCMTHDIKGGIPKTHVIHHKDRDRTNDHPDNLEMLTHAAHNELHEGDPRPSPFLGKKHTPKTIAAMSQAARERGNNDIWGGDKTEHFESTIEKMSEKARGASNAMYRHDLDDEAIRRAYEQIGSLQQVARIFGCSVQAVRNRIQGERSGDWRQLSDEELLTQYEEAGRNIHRLSLKINAPQTSLWRKIKKIGESHEAGIH